VTGWSQTWGGLPPALPLRTELALTPFFAPAFKTSSGLGRSPWEVPFGMVDDEGMKLIDSLKGYGELPMDQVRDGGVKWIKESGKYPELDYFKQCVIIGDTQAKKKHDL
jgi:hypothetical protein